MHAGSYYHIYNRGINKQPIFFDEANYLYFLQQFKKYVCNYVSVFAYCLMPNHFHFFLRIEDQHSIRTNVSNLNLVEKAFKDFFISYSKSINKRYNRTGALFQYKFKRKEVNDINHYTWLTYYIHSNPVHAGLCNHPREWKFSSYNAYLSNKETLVSRREILGWFGGQEQLQLFHEKNMQAEEVYKAFEKALDLD